MKLEESSYGLVLLDKEIPSISLSEMTEVVDKTPTIMFVDPIGEIDEQDKMLFANVVTNTISKKSLEDLVREYI